jgi:hypothetical protein
MDWSRGRISANPGRQGRPVVGDFAGLVTLTVFRAVFLEQPNDCASHCQPDQG